MLTTILIVDDERNTREGLAQVLEDHFAVSLAASAQEAFDWMERETFDVILTDLRMAGKSGLSVVDKALEVPYKPICIMMTAYGTVETAVQAMKRGVFDFLTKPINIEKLEILIQRALETRKLKEDNVQLNERLDTTFKFDNIIGRAPVLLKVLESVKQVAPTKASILIEGETGTGKELIAQMIHQNSPRNRAPFISVHCGALPSNLLESELFGHEKGSFTGASERRIGRFEAAHTGTLFLDEIGEIDLPTQIKLLRFLETRTFERIGSNKPISVDIRLISATHKDLQAMVSAGTFREDLYYRLNIIAIKLPALRERPEDIPLLLHHYIRFFSKENGFTTPTISFGALKRLQKYSWLGNIRQLRNFCESIVILNSGSGSITEADLEAHFTTSEIHSNANLAPELVSPQNTYDSPEKHELKNALILANGNRTLAAERLGISRRTLHRKLQRWPELAEF